jgi:phage shock protein A
MSNRVEELESQVAELQAAVDGLTEELVETRERLRQLEADRDDADAGPTREPARTEAAEEAETVDQDPEPEPEPESGVESEVDDVADAGPEAAPAEAEDEDSSDSDGGDIIVA